MKNCNSIPVEVIEKILSYTGRKCHTCQLLLNLQFQIKYGNYDYCSHLCFIGT